MLKGDKTRKVNIEAGEGKMDYTRFTYKLKTSRKIVKKEIEKMIDLGNRQK